jgi:hypothetical protein
MKFSKIDKMIQTQNLVPFEIHKLGIEVLTKELGISGMLDFIEFYEKGSGNYTEERRETLKEQNVDELAINSAKTRHLK